MKDGFFIPKAFRITGAISLGMTDEERVLSFMV